MRRLVDQLDALRVRGANPVREAREAIANGDPDRALAILSSRYRPRDARQAYEELLAEVPRLAGDAVGTPERGDIGPDGRLVGVDGIIDQIGEGLRRQVEPILRDTVLPYIERDHGLQQRIGAAAGNAIADRFEPWVMVGAISLALLAYSQLRRMK